MFADDLRDLRARSGMTITELAERSHTSRAAITDYEAGRKQPRFDTADRVLRALGHTIAIAHTPREPEHWRAPLDDTAVLAIERARRSRSEAISSCDGDGSRATFTASSTPPPPHRFQDPLLPYARKPTDPCSLSTIEPTTDNRCGQISTNTLQKGRPLEPSRKRSWAFVETRLAAHVNPGT